MNNPNPNDTLKLVDGNVDSTDENILGEVIQVTDALVEDESKEKNETTNLQYIKEETV